MYKDVKEEFGVKESLQFSLYIAVPFGKTIASERANNLLEECYPPIKVIGNRLR